MMKRVTWFAGGVAAGLSGAAYTKRKVKRTVQRRADQFSGPITVTRVAATAARTTRRRVVDLADAVRDGRTAMRAKEDELRARRDMSAEPIEEHLEPGTQLLIDGKPADMGRVIVLRPHDNRANRRTRRRSS